MSWVTDVLLITGLGERFDDDRDDFVESCKALDNINTWLEQHEQGKLDELSDYVVSGGKGMQCYVYGGAFNFLEVDDFVSLVLSQKWKNPKAVMLLTKESEHTVFTVHQII